MKPSVDFIFDFGSPNAYLAWKVLPGMLKATGWGVNVIPCLLGGIFKLTGNQAPMSAYGGIKGKLEYERLETQRFIDRHALMAFRFNPHFPINTLTIMRALIAARRLGVSDVFFEATLKAMWEDGQKMDDVAVIAALLSGVGLDAPVILETAQQPAVKAELIANTDAAVARGVFGIPTFFVRDEMFFGKDRLEQVTAAVNGVSTSD